MDISIGIFLIPLILIAFSLVVLLAIANIIKQVTIVDIFWALGFIIIFWGLACAYIEEFTPRIEVYALMLNLWAFRLSGFLAIRNWGKGEDKRYIAIRRSFAEDNKFLTQAFGVFGIQAALILFLSGPTYINIVFFDYEVTIFEFLGFSIWLFGFIFESIADYQLYQFKNNPKNKGKILDDGLWHYSRHPNYFGEACIWVGYALFSISIPFYGIYGVICALVMIYLLLQISGVKLLDDEMSKNYPKKYEDYMRSTPAFIPWKKKK